MTAERWPPWRHEMELDAGLLFICYQRDPRTGFIKIFDKMAKFDMLNQFVTAVGGGMFACPWRRSARPLSGTGFVRVSLTAAARTPLANGSSLNYYGSGPTPIAGLRLSLGDDMTELSRRGLMAVLAAAGLPTLASAQTAAGADRRHDRVAQRRARPGTPNVRFVPDAQPLFKMVFDQPPGPGSGAEAHPQPDQILGAGAGTR